MINNSKTNSMDATHHDRSVMFQVSLMQGLAYGDYYGSLSLAELKQHGDTGLGTFDKLNGELIMLDGMIYRVSGDGSVEIVSDSETTPFSAVTFMKEDETKQLKEIYDYSTLINELDKVVRERGVNRFYMIRIDGVFREINVRSVYAQNEPYRKLLEVLEDDQTFFDFENIEGTVVGLYCPPYMSALNAVGWHMHFISGDKNKGGHVLGLNISDAMLTWDYIDSFQVQLTPSEMFSDFDLTVDQSDDIKKIETNK